MCHTTTRPTAPNYTPTADDVAAFLQSLDASINDARADLESDPENAWLKGLIDGLTEAKLGAIKNLGASQAVPPVIDDGYRTDCKRCQPSWSDCIDCPVAIARTGGAA